MSLPANLSIAAQAYLTMRAELIEEFPELAEDVHALADTLDGETEAADCVVALIRDALDDEAFAGGCREREKAMAERRHRLEARAEKRRTIALRLMQLMERRKIEAPDVTVSVRAIPPKAVVPDPLALPREYLRIKTEVDMAAVGKALKAGEVVPGAYLDNGNEGLSVRVR